MIIIIFVIIIIIVMIMIIIIIIIIVVTNLLWRAKPMWSNGSLDNTTASSLDAK